MHAQALDLIALNLPSAPRVTTQAGGDLAPGFLPEFVASDWVPRLRAQAKGWPGRAVVVLAPPEALQGPAADLMRALPVAVLQAPVAMLGPLAWRWSKALQQQGNRVTFVSSRAPWGQLVDQRVDWQPKLGTKKVVTLADFAKETGLSRPVLAPAHTALTLALAAPSALAQDLLARHGTLGALLDAAQDFLAFSREPAKAQPLTQDDVRERVAKLAQAWDFGRLPSESANASEQAAWWRGSLDELNAAEALVDLGLPECVAEFDEWLKPWRACDMARADWLQLSRAWESARVA